VVTLQKFTAEQELKRLGYSSTGKAINRVPFVVFAKWVTSHWHSAIVVKGMHCVEHVAPHMIGVHQNAMRKLTVEQRSGRLASGSCHSVAGLFVDCCEPSQSTSRQRQGADASVSVHDLSNISGLE
jgi:hypothetical protein